MTILAAADWKKLRAQLEKHGPSRDIDREIHAGIGMPTYSDRIVPKYTNSPDASQRILIQKGVNWRLQVHNGEAHALAQIKDAWLDARGPVSDIGKVQATVMLMVMELTAGTG